MTKKDYELIARVFWVAITDSRTNEPDKTEAYRDLARFMAKKLSKENPKFDTDKFLTACGIHWEVYHYDKLVGDFPTHAEADAYLIENYQRMPRIPNDNVTVYHGMTIKER